MGCRRLQGYSAEGLKYQAGFLSDDSGVPGVGFGVIPVEGVLLGMGGDVLGGLVQGGEGILMASSIVAGAGVDGGSGCSFSGGCSSRWWMTVKSFSSRSAFVGCFSSGSFFGVSVSECLSSALLFWGASTCFRMARPAL